MPAKDEWEEKFQKWKEEKKLREKREKELDVFYHEEKKKLEKQAEPKIESSVKVPRKKSESQRKILIGKILIILIPILIVNYLIYANFLLSHDFEYTYDIGNNENYLSPAARVSAAVEGDENYRNLVSNLVYFDVPIARDAEKIIVEVKFRDNFPIDGVMSIGAKDEEVWHYNYHRIYNPTLDFMLNSPNKEGVYLVNQEREVVGFEELQNERNVVIATDKSYPVKQNSVSGYRKEKTVIANSIRGAHTAYIYAERDLELKVTEKDINWYEGADELNVALYDLEGNLISSMKIEDDGETGVSKKQTPEQTGILRAENLKRGIYKIEFEDFDGLITKIEINTNKIVFEKVFLADNSLYNVQTKPSRIYTETGRSGQLIFTTYHAAGIQKVDFKKNGVAGVFDVFKEDEPVYMEVEDGEYEMNIPQNDVIVSGNSYISFSKENYFEPFSQKVIAIRNDIDWLERNVDYIVTDYRPPVQKGNWLVGATEFDINQEELFVKDNKLSMVFNIPHLSQEEFQNQTIAVDWIKITVHKPGLFEKFGGEDE